MGKMKNIIIVIILVAFVCQDSGIGYHLSIPRLRSGQAMSNELSAKHTLRPQSARSQPVKVLQGAKRLLKADIHKINRNHHAAAFLRKKGAVNPEIIEILGEPHMHSDISQYPEYLREEILRQEKKGVEFLIARISADALATSYRGRQTYLSDILFNPEYPAPAGLLYMYIRHEASKHSSLKKEAEAVMREIDAWNSLPESEQRKVRDWADWYVNEMIRRGIDVSKNIVKDSFYSLAKNLRQKSYDMSMIEHYVTAKYGEIHLKKRHDIQRRLHYAAVTTVLVACFLPALTGYTSLLSSGIGFLLAAILYYVAFRYIASSRLNYLAGDASMIDDYKGVKDGSHDEGRVYHKNLLKLVSAYKANPYWYNTLMRKDIVRKHFLSQIVQPQVFGEKTDRELAPEGGMVRSPIRSNAAASILVEHFLASSLDVFSEPAWAALIEDASLNEKTWFEKSASVMDLAVNLPFCADKLVRLLCKAQNGELAKYKIKDMNRFIATLSKMIRVLGNENKNFKCRAILYLCDMVDRGRKQEALFANALLKELKFYIVRASNFNQVSADIASHAIEEIVEANGHANIVLGGGGTVTQPYHLGLTKIPSIADQLAVKKQKFNWNSDVAVWQLSEYAGLSVEHPSSHAHSLSVSFFSKVFNDANRNVHFIGENPDPRGFIESQKQAGGIDLIVGGVGSDGHFGYNFPGSTADPFSAGSLLKVKLPPETIAANISSYPDISDNPFAWTMGLADIIQPAEGKKPKVIVLVLGSKKAQMLKKSLKKPDSPLAKIIHELDTTVIVTDEAISSPVTGAVTSLKPASRCEAGLQRSLSTAISTSVAVEPKSKTSSAGGAENEPIKAEMVISISPKTISSKPAGRRASEILFLISSAA